MVLCDRFGEVVSGYVGWLYIGWFDVFLYTLVKRPGKQISPSYRDVIDFFEAF